MSDPHEISALRTEVERLSLALGRLEDVHAIRRLQHAYGYYLDKCLYDEVVDLFADDGEVRFMGGIFRGKAGVQRLYCGRFRANFTGGYNGPVHGFLLDHPQLQDIVDVAPDRARARARFRSFMQAGSHETRKTASGTSAVPRQWWEGGIYENEYVRDGGLWRIRVLNYRPVYHAVYEQGWAHTPEQFVPFYSETYPKDPVGPDELIEPRPTLWPHTDVVPFHYVHPVTGKTWTPAPR
ncbi:MAG TPA: nuclear transport factor 2 family protein [Steroidobacteraceae bacterium]|nr:nuclear transport factor 2 family protein [Steroidobacteraceae bacterium]